MLSIMLATCGWQYQYYAGWRLWCVYEFAVGAAMSDIDTNGAIIESTQLTPAKV